MRAVHAVAGIGHARQHAQSLVEAALSFILLTSMIGMTVTVGWWAHAENVVTAAIQDGARAASAVDGDATRGRSITLRLLQVGLGTSANLVDVAVTEDVDSVTFVARGKWPILAGPGVTVDLPLSAAARVIKERWRP